MIDINEERFFALVEAAFAQIPDELTGLLDNVALFVEDDAPDDGVGAGAAEGAGRQVDGTRHGGIDIGCVAARLVHGALSCSDASHEGEGDTSAYDRCLLGLYVGTPLTERDTSYAGAMPDRIMIYRRPTLRICHTEDDVVREVAITVAHEIAHHFGIDDDRLHELGYA